MSEESRVFSKLAHDLSLEERKILYDRLSAQYSEQQAESLIKLENDESETHVVNEYYSRLSFFRRIILTVKAAFAHREVIELAEQEMLNRLARNISQNQPEMYQYRTGLLGEAFFASLESLRTKLRALHEPLMYAFSGDRKAFLGYLAAALIPIENQKLQKVSDPSALSSEKPENEFELRRTIEITTRDALAAIGKEMKATIYSAYRALIFLHELVSLPVFKIASNDAAASGGVPTPKLRKDLSDLCDILFSLRAAPSTETLDALLRFRYLADSEEGEADGVEVAGIEAELIVALDAIGELQSFSRKIPLLGIMKVINRNVAYVPDLLGGGEEWYNQFRQYWEERAERNITSFLHSRRIEEFEREARTLFGATVECARTLDRYHNRNPAKLYRVRYAETAGFLLTFYDALFTPGMSRILKTFLVNGEFYKPSNREEMTDSYNGLAALADTILAVDKNLGSESDDGKKIARIETKLESIRARSKQVANIIARIDSAMETAIRDAMVHIDAMNHVVKGIRYGESGGAYDTLMNIKTIGGAENKSLLRGLDKALGQLESTRRLLHKIFDLERGLEIE